MLGLLRLAGFGALALILLYVMVSVYSRSVRREKLEDRAAEKISEGTLAAEDRDDYIETGMAAYEHSLRKKLIWGVIVVPTLTVLVLIYVTNFM